MRPSFSSSCRSQENSQTVAAVRSLALVTTSPLWSINMTNPPTDDDDVFILHDATDPLSACPHVRRDFRRTLIASGPYRRLRVVDAWQTVFSPC